MTYIGSQNNNNDANLQPYLYITTLVSYKPFDKFFLHGYQYLSEMFEHLERFYKNSHHNDTKEKNDLSGNAMD